MRLATRMKITYGMVFFIPILLMVITFWGMGRIELRTLRQKYDMQNAGMEVLIDPFQVLGNMSSSVVEELLATATWTGWISGCLNMILSWSCGGIALFTISDRMRK